MADNSSILIDSSIRTAWFRLSRMYNQKAAEHDMTMSIGFILMNIDKEGTPSTQLGPRMGMEPTSLSRTLKTMETRGLIRRQGEGVDKRKVLIFLTDEGIEKRREVRDFLIDFNTKVFEKMPPSKIKAFLEVIEKIENTIDKELELKELINKQKIKV
ncbi:winged helix-turn-helix transcriptional regulator [Crocinitomicaceae bacterium CZZ-1]|uniref:Winged helix-turn-helix transcriptional regulator n=1 Tax=Taishania pollutisoli TaxID=2766479 RepID=A0A8J6P9Z6_9FLAO|nr:MarR family winged helix-turn-helix transcriptional regulator [Taishania pollutisoli]MBC9811413.1 winged helix-turn-helix transcriptional regulator [Taishania pollutisoli]MBX2947667.1 winged helix-turn-helix transcriptional regulator [Crocinitomicaceae bacterium]NGF75198.1 winged helix-turn-helix transcriptional regulator [Fluviicola sp. SGL-29]